MKELKLPAAIKSIRGQWNVTDDLKVANVQKRDIYRAPTEPSWVSWAILCKMKF